MCSIDVLLLLVLINVGPSHPESFNMPFQFLLRSRGRWRQFLVGGQCRNENDGIGFIKVFLFRGSHSDWR